jgi:SAM-dependent methyltransferase
MLKLHNEAGTVRGYRASMSEYSAKTDWSTTTEYYACDQLNANARITREYLLPVLQRVGCRTVLDVGCGVGESVVTLLKEGYDAYGVDLTCLASNWEQLGRAVDRFFVIAPDHHELPFDDGSLDFAYSFGVIEHVGTVDGHATRQPDYHARREYWLREIYRVVRPGGHLLIGGPNRGFPLDFSHDLDAEAGALERWLSRAAGVSIHRTWGDYFLWGYEDFGRYLAGLDYRMTGLSIRDLLKFSRVPGPFRSFARWYVNNLPSPLRATGLNPWVMALIEKRS